MDMIKLIKGNWLRIIIAIIIWLNMPRIIDYGLTLYYGEHPADRIKSQLTKMYQEIEPLPGATIFKEGSFVREKGGSVYGDYLTDLSIQEVLSYYDKEFKRDGWSFKEIDIVTEGKTDTGRRSARYTKGDYMGFIGIRQ